MDHHQPVPVSKWLPTIHHSFDTYAQLLTDFGYDDTRIILSAELDDLRSDLEEMGVKKPHCRLLLKGVKELKEQEGVESKPRQGPGVSAMLEVDVVSSHKASRESSARQRLESYSKAGVDGVQAHRMHANKYVGKLNKAEALKSDQMETKRAFAAAQNLKTETVHTKKKVQDVVQPVVKRTGTERKLQVIAPQVLDAVLILCHCCVPQGCQGAQTASCR